LFSSCSKYGGTSFKWLQGRWEQRSPTDTVTESWSKLENGVYEGMASMTQGGKIVFSENMRIEKKEGTLYYIVTVPDQNSGKPVLFKYQGGLNDTYVFENNGHDWPQRIIYHYIPSYKAQDSIIATVEGTDSGKVRKEVFRYGKVEDQGD
jgi:hypothetical protein